MQAEATIATESTPIVENGKLYTANSYNSSRIINTRSGERSEPTNCDDLKRKHDFIRWSFSFYDPAMAQYSDKMIANRYFRETGKKISIQLVSRNKNWYMINGIIYKHV